ncbi:MAG: Rhodanese domain protein [Herbinix sp.]|jgi:rhodanese-related sulfurtransferase|nr:Rhodanese domain protein [Herbinix sp.]
MKKITYLYIIAILFVSLVTGCSSGNNKTEEPTDENSSSVYEKITAEEAKEIIDSDKDFIILDVRTEEEYNSGHIEGAILIPDTQILDKAEELLQDKDLTLLIYCRSGRRSALSAENLKDLGYTNIYDFGGITDWPYDIVTDD